MSIELLLFGVQTAGCGVSYEDHLRDTSALTKRSFIYFMFYYCTAKNNKTNYKSPTTKQMLHSVITKNQYDKSRISKNYAQSFNVSPSTDLASKNWNMAVKDLVNGVHTLKPDGTYRHQHEDKGPFFQPSGCNKLMVETSVMLWTTFYIR